MREIVKNKTGWTIGLLIAIFVCVCYSSVMSFKTMPIAEGWYTEYAWQINNGSLPYRDFEYLFFPFYIYLIAGFTKIFGYSIFALRVFGVVLFGAIGGAFYVLYSKLFDNLSAMVASIASALFMQSEVVQIFYDYIRVHDLFAIITTIFLVEATFICLGKKKEIKSRITAVLTVLAVLLLAVFCGTSLIMYIASGIYISKKNIAFVLLLLATVTLLVLEIRRKKISSIGADIPLCAILCGIFVSLECMVKQSTGILMIVFTMAYFMFCRVMTRKKEYFYSLMGIIVGIVISFSIMGEGLSLTNSLDPFIANCFIHAASAKGGIANELFRWLPASFSQLWSIRTIMIALIVFGEVMVLRIQNARSQGKVLPKEEKVRTAAMVITGAVLLVICIAIPNDISLATTTDSWYSGSLPTMAFYLCSIAFFALAFVMLAKWISKEEVINNKNIKYLVLFPVLGVVFAQGYGVGMSGGLCSSQTAIGFGLVLAFFCNLAQQSLDLSAVSVMLVASLFLVASFAGQKVSETYNWWGLTAGSLMENTEDVNVPLLEGIKVRPADKLCYETVYQDVITHTSEDDTIFAFPQCPIFYTITGRHSDTFSKVQWFDVSSMESITRDIESMQEKLPQMIIYSDVPEFVYQGHEGAFKTRQTRKMKDFLMGLVQAGKYTELNRVDIGNGYSVVTYVLNDVISQEVQP